MPARERKCATRVGGKLPRQGRGVVVGEKLVESRELGTRLHRVHPETSRVQTRPQAAARKRSHNFNTVYYSSRVCCIKHVLVQHSTKLGGGAGGVVFVLFCFKNPKIPNVFPHHAWRGFSSLSSRVRYAELEQRECFEKALLELLNGKSLPCENKRLRLGQLGHCTARATEKCHQQGTFRVAVASCRNHRL